MNQMDFPYLHLYSLEQRSKDLEQQKQKLMALLSEVNQSTKNIVNEMNALIFMAEQECQNMVDFDVELAQIRKKLFPSQSKRSHKGRVKEVTQNIILEELKILKKFTEVNFDMYIRGRDPVLNAITEDVSIFSEFSFKYKSVLGNSYKESSIL